MADNTTKVPNKIVIIALKLTSKASAPYFATPELSRNVSFSRNPREGQKKFHKKKKKKKKDSRVLTI